MIARRLLARAALLVVALPLLSAGCGGGNDADAGGLAAFNIVPTSLSLKGPDAATCGAGYAGRVYVYGGAGPYRVDNTGASNDPNFAYVEVSKSTVDRPGDYFEVTTLGGCMTNISVVVVDQLGRQVTLTVSTVKGD